jgi:hypothetical protein
MNSIDLAITTPCIALLGEAPPPPAETFFILLESGDALLQENGDNLLLEEAP